MAVQGQYARNKARRNRNVNAYIDESLFGSQAKTVRSNSRRGVHSSPTNVPAGPDLSKAVVVSTRELDYIKQSSVVVTKEMRAQRARELAQARSANLAKAKARKERMLRMEEERKASAPDLTESEQLALESQNELLAHAKKQMDQEKDDVKHMNQMVLYAKCSTIRDAQILEKQRIQELLAEEERRQDMVMEIERIKSLKAHEEKEAAKAIEQRIGAQVIIQQIQEREAERIRQQELREQEAQAMVQRIKELELKEEEERQQKILAGKELLKQVMTANQAQARDKIARKQEELEEDMRIMNYLKEKELRESREEAEKARICAAKDAEHQKMMMAQEKILDQTEALDELRAKRYQEAKERKWRRSQLALAKKQQEAVQDVNRVRTMQIQFKADAMAEQAIREKEEFMRVLEVQQAQNAADAQVEIEAVKRASAHRNSILAQIEEREAEKVAARKAFLTEGSGYTRENNLERRRLNRIKAEKLAQLEAAGVPAKYRTELAKKKVLVSSIH